MQRLQMADAKLAIRQWLALKDEDEMLQKWPGIVRNLGVDEIGRWRSHMNKNRPAVVHELTRHGKRRVLECVSDVEE